MIKKITLEGFNDLGDLGGAKYEGQKLKYFKKTKKQKKHQNKYVFWFFLVYWTGAHHILHVGIFLHSLSIWNGPRAWGALK